MLPRQDEGLLSFLRNEHRRARDTALDDARATAIRAYFGEPYGDEEDGSSKAVTRDVSEVTDIMLVGILGAALSGGKPVEFDTEPEDVPEPTQENPQATRRVDYGAEATAAVTYQFMRRQPGYRILHDATKAGLLEKTGITKTYAYPQRALEVEDVVPGAAIEDDGETLTLLDGTPLLAVEAVDPLADPLDPAAEYRVTYAEEQPRVIRDLNVPNEWFRLPADVVELDEAPYLGDDLPVSKSDLIAMGFDQADVDAAWQGAPPESVVGDARDAERSIKRSTVQRRPGAGQQLWLHHEFAYFDLDGDGIAEHLDVMRVGNTIFRILPAEEQPYSGWTPVPMAHRFTGQSIADKTQDIQRIRTVLLRNALNSLYLSSAPRMMLDVNSETETTVDDLLTVRPGMIVRYKGGTPPTPLTITDTSQVSFAAMETVRAERDARTGVTGQSQGMNPDSLNKTASGMAMLQQNADQIELYVTRNLAEMLLLPMFAKRYRLMRRHQQPFRMKINGKYVEVDPAQWPEDIDVQINVGLGTGSKDQQVGYRRELLGMMQAAAAGGSRLVTDQQLFNAGKAFVEDTSLGVATDFFRDPSQLPPEQEDGPDADVVAAQGKTQTDQMRLGQEHELKLFGAQTDREVRLAGVDSDAAIKREAAAAEAELREARAQAEATLAERRQTFEEDLAVRRLVFEQELARERASFSATDDALPVYRPGGDLAQ